jgi:hypothetical protein
MHPHAEREFSSEEGQPASQPATERERKMGVLLPAGRLRVEPAIVFPVIARVRLVYPTVRQRTHPGGFSILDVQAERRVSLPVLVCLQPDRVSIRERKGARIIEPGQQHE